MNPVYVLMIRRQRKSARVLDVKNKAVPRQVDQRWLVAGGRPVPGGKIRWKEDGHQGGVRAGGGAGWVGDVFFIGSTKVVYSLVFGNGRGCTR